MNHPTTPDTLIAHNTRAGFPPASDDSRPVRKRLNRSDWKEIDALYATLDAEWITAGRATHPSARIQPTPAHHGGPIMSRPTGSLIRPAFVTRAMLRTQRYTYFAFGDNMQRAGFGGQAREMRGEPNAIGIPTKWSPHRGAAAFFRDSDWDRQDVRHAITRAFDRLDAALQAGRTVAIPADGLGTGRAELPIRAPRIAAIITERIARLEAIAASRM